MLVVLFSNSADGHTHHDDSVQNTTIGNVENLLVGDNLFVQDQVRETRDEQFRCSYCPKTFAKRHHTLRHEMIHSGVKPYSCSVCSIQFSDTSTLRQHMRIHTGETPYRCDDCCKSFRWRNSFRTHSCSLTKRCNQDNGRKAKHQRRTSRRQQKYQNKYYESGMWKRIS